MSGPACGCQEHSEARRREIIFMKKAYQLQAVRFVLLPEVTDLVWILKLCIFMKVKASLYTTNIGYINTRTLLLWFIGINPMGLGFTTPQILGWATWGLWSLHEMLSYPVVQEHEMRRLSKSGHFS